MTFVLLPHRKNILKMAVAQWTRRRREIRPLPIYRMQLVETLARQYEALQKMKTRPRASVPCLSLAAARRRVSLMNWQREAGTALLLRRYRLPRE